MLIYAVDGQPERKTTNPKSRSTTVGMDRSTFRYMIGSFSVAPLVCALSVSNPRKTGTRRDVEMLDSAQEEYNPAVGSGMRSIGRTVHPRLNFYSQFHRPS